MGKKNSKLKQETIDSLTHDTYCKFRVNYFVILLFFFCHFSSPGICDLPKFKQEKGILFPSNKGECD